MGLQNGQQQDDGAGMGSVSLLLQPVEVLPVLGMVQPSKVSLFLYNTCPNLNMPVERIPCSLFDTLFLSFSFAFLPGFPFLPIVL